MRWTPGQKPSYRDEIGLVRAGRCRAAVDLEGVAVRVAAA
jgi:hypothetical protein